MRDSFYTLYGKRLLDIVIALVALFVTLPINLLLAFCAYFDVGHPIIFKQQRIGKNEVPFIIYKFRNMTNETDENGKLLPPRMRVTKFGKIVRACSLDELLQFWNILVGEMSVIGPRPLLVDYKDEYNDRQKMRHLVKPGLECPMLTKIDRVRTWEEQFENDVQYVENVSFWLDLKLIYMLVLLVFDIQHVQQRSNDTRGRAFPNNNAGGVE